MKERELFDTAFREVTRDKAGITERIRKLPRSPDARYISSGALLSGLGGGMFYLGYSVNPLFLLGGVFPAGIGGGLILGKVVTKAIDPDPPIHKRAYQVAISEVSKAYESQQENPPSKEQIETLLKKIFYLPPVGGKITLERNSLRPTPLFPALTADEKVEEIIKFRQNKELDRAYVHQLTVQGRLPDEFKYAALALIINSTYRSDWSKPFYEADWAKVAPLIHGGGRVTDVNPLWRSKGRTDFIQRVATVYEPELENMEQYASTPQLATQFSSEALDNAVLEQEERRRLILEFNFYQRAAFALHAKIGTVPNAVPPDVAENAMQTWESFVKGMDNILNSYDASKITKPRWFTRAPRMFLSWGEFRYEGNYGPIREALMSLEEIKSKNPSLRREVNLLMTKTVSSIDNAIGI